MRKGKQNKAKLRELSAFDLKVLSFTIIVLTLTTIGLALYAFTLKIQKSRVDVIVKEIKPESSEKIVKAVRTATETIYITEETSSESPLFYQMPSETIDSTSASNVSTVSTPSTDLTTSVDIQDSKTSEKTELKSNLEKTAKTSDEKSSKDISNTQQLKADEPEKSESQENPYFKNVAKIDYDMLLARMAENLPKTVMYVYTVTLEEAISIAKTTEYYLINKVGTKYYVATLKPGLLGENSSKGFFTIQTDPTKDSKEVFKSIVNLRTFGISAFSIKDGNDYFLCMGVYPTEGSAKEFYYSQDWGELAKYSMTKGAKVIFVGQ